MRKITLGHFDISHKGKAYVNDILYTSRLSYGPYTKRLEEMFASLHKCKHAIFLNSGTSALQVALAVLKECWDWWDDDEILVPAVTFIATSNVVLQNNLKPVFVDVDPQTFNMDPDKIREKISLRTKAILPVHLFGLPTDMPEIMKIANAYELRVLEDSCETMFADIKGKSVGSWGDMAAFSTYVAHIITGGVGGFITTNDDHLADLARSSMAHGRDSIYTNIDQDDLINKEMIERRFKFERVGYSYRCTEIEAAIALSELERWEENINQRWWNATYLTEELRDLENILQLPYTPASHSHSFMVYPMVLNANFNRDKFLLYLEQAGIETRYLMPLLSQPIYRKLFPGMEEKYPVAQRVTKQGFYIGIHQGLGKEDMDYISNVIHNYKWEVDYNGFI